MNLIDEQKSSSDIEKKSRMISFRMPYAMDSWLNVKAMQTGLKVSEVILLCLCQGAMAHSSLRLVDHVNALKISKKQRKKRESWIAYDAKALRTFDAITAHLYDSTKDQVASFWEFYEQEKKRSHD